MSSHLPCVKCGSSISIVEGSLVQCFNCGTKNVHSESLNLLNDYLLEIMNKRVSDLLHQEIDNEETENRKRLVEGTFHDYNSQYFDNKYLIVTKLDELNKNPIEVLNFAKDLGCLHVVVDEFLLPHLKESVSKDIFIEIRSLSKIYNETLLGLYFSLLSKDKYKLEDCSKFYQFAQRNYENVVEFCDSIKLSNPSFNITKIKVLSSVLARFSNLLRNILTENPTYSTQKFEELFKELDKIKQKDMQVLNLWSQIENVYTLGRDTSLILEELRLKDPFSRISTEENLMYSMEENLEKLDSIRDWINQISDKYKSYQSQLLKLHSGQFIEYLQTYRTEFTNRRERSIEQFDELLERIITKATIDYNLETIEALDILSNYVRKEEIDQSPEILIQRFEIDHDDLVKLDDNLKLFVTECFKKSFVKNLEAEHYSELVQMISEKHSEFDRYILKYITHLLREFEEKRNEKILSLEEQRNLFIVELKPNVKRLIDASFTLKEEMVPYPLFIAIIMLSRQLAVNHPEKISVLIENPNLVDIKNINVSFFMPNSFQSSLRYAQLKKIKSQDGRKIETEITPTEKGIFHFMVMIEYQTTGIKETFWMPSIKIELEVEEDY